MSTRKIDVERLFGEVTVTCGYDPFGSASHPLAKESLSSSRTEGDRAEQGLAQGNIDL